eukprot:TRINITY_DN1144_c0_g1_i8.p1 TRINITY_DN1144_c0_g1~~TRINITY_DN1144_c0_g1_i8.p1  ORF type:complete len:167 (+),score=42.80 TRINITY_DN1144_c0_g1_i8:21-521(+)
MEAVVSTQSTGELTSPVVAMSSTKDFSQLTPAERMKQKHNIQNSVRTGGKGSVRRKVKVQRRPQGTDDKKVIQALKGLGLNQVPGVDQVEMLRKDGTTLIFKNPKVQAAVNANTYVISGSTPESKDSLPESAVPSAREVEEGDDDVPDLVPGGDINFEDVATGTAQ